MEEAAQGLTMCALFCVLVAACCCQLLSSQDAEPADPTGQQSWREDANRHRVERISVSSKSDVVSVSESSDEAEEPDFQVDDDSEECVARRDFCRRRQQLVTGSVERASLIKFSSQGIFVYVMGILGCQARNIPVSKVVAQRLAGTLPTDARVLKKGKLSRIADGAHRFKLTLPAKIPGVGQSCQRGRLLICDSVFYNFATQRWQPTARLGAYMPPRYTLYCAFVPQDDLLFIKIGYRALTDKKTETILAYIEQKTKRLRITNVPGAGLFLIPLPTSHEDFEDPARAAEESLKSDICGSQLLQACPSSCNMEFTTFSSSLEYFLVKARVGNQSGSTLDALTATLRDFSGDPKLRPFRAVATRRSGHVRTGKRKLVCWSEQAPKDLHPHKIASLVPISSMRSRQKLAKTAPGYGPFARRLSRRWHESIPRAKRQRKAVSCP